jgi:hypothetical protein
MMKYLKYISILLFFGLLFSCGKNESVDQKIVATVGGRNITAAEFSLQYELTPSKYTRLGKEKSFDLILDGIVNKILFAEEAQKIGLDNDPEIKKIIEHHKHYAIICELYKKHIRDSIEVTEEELRSAFRKSKITLFVKHFITTNSDEAYRISKGLKTVSHIPLLDVSKTREIGDYGVVDIISWNEVNREIEDILYHLPLLKLSEPYFDGKIYHVFRVVDKEIDVMQTEGEFVARKSSIASAIRKRKEHYAAFDFVKRAMQSQNLIIKAEPLNSLTEIAWNNYTKNGIKLENLKYEEVGNLFDNKRELLSEKLAMYQDGSMTVEDFIFTYKLNPVNISFKNKSSVRKGLENAVAIYVRDRIFVAMGLQENLDKLPPVTEEARNWEERLLSNSLKQKIFNELAETIFDSTELISKYDSTISELLSNLRGKVNIKINKEELYAVQTTDSGLPRKIDFFAIHTQ